MTDSILDSVPQKQCLLCKQFFPLTREFFTADKGKRDGFRERCKKCKNIHVEKEILPEGYKRCSKCKEIKIADKEHFFSGKGTRDSLNSQCKTCILSQQKEKWAQGHPREIDNIPDGYKRCIDCKEIKPATTSHFHAKNNTKSGLNGKCKLCRIKEENERVMRISMQRETALDISNSKKCSTCNEEKPMDNFDKNYRTRDGRHYTCKDCMSNQQHEVYMRNQEERKRRAREYRANNLEIVRMRNRIYIQRNRQEILKKRLAYGARNREVINQKSREYAKTHRQQRKVNNHNRRARMKGNGGTHTYQDIVKQYKRQKSKCYYCGKKVEWGKHHIDHIVPLSRGGSNGPDNLVITCPTCNLKKNDKLLHEWIEGGRLL